MSPTNRNTQQVTLEGRGTVTLRPSDHVATGGEGSIYRISDMAVKIYLEPEKMRARGTPQRIQKLMAFRHPYVGAPRGLALDAQDNPIGYYMLFVEDPPVGYPLSMVFTNDFYKSEGFTAQRASTLVDRMREVVKFSHDNGALLIDPNELNWFAVSVRTSPEPRIIDVDSWIVGPMPPTVAVMPSIRDWHAKKFGQESDWFAWGVVTFQIYTGIHPYKGTLDGYARADVEQRMKNNASVFTPGVRLNRAVRDFSCIPWALLSWYRAAFEKGERVAPPSPFDTGITTPRAAQVLRVATTGKTGMLVFEKILGITGDPVTRVFHCGVALLASGKLIDLQTKRQIAVSVSPTCEVVKVGHGWLIGHLENRTASLAYVNEQNLNWGKMQFQTQAHRLLGYENRMFIVTDNGLTEIKSNLFGEKLIASAGKTWGVIVNSTKWFSGVGVLDAMGAKFVVVPFGDDSVAQVRVRELDGVRVIAGKAGNRFVSFIVVEKSGDYRKIELTLDHDYRTYKIWTDIADGPELNMAMLPKGVAAIITRDGELSVYVPTNGNLTKVRDGQIATDMLLSNWEDHVVYVQNGEVWAVRMN